MKVEIKVTELTHEELVDLFATGLEGNAYLYSDYDGSFWQSIPDNKKEGDCYEDHLADVILNGGSILLGDAEADGELYTEAGVPCKIETLGWWESGDPEDDDYQMGTYEVSLEHILKGCSTPRGFDLLQELLNGGGDIWTAYNLLQIIMFGKEIYG